MVGDTIFAVTNEEASRVVAMGLDGKLLWEETLEPASYALSAPTVIDGVLYVASDEGYIYAYSSGTETVEEEFPWLLVGGIIALVIVAAVGLVYWNSKKKGM
ncbi:MAG: PQQ-like beta-propeller repeat protein [Euryarchaeota archaeon]|nr:PQQ-like beta-propeller repeat protein [Euryarchaeota archaeon]